MQKSKLRFIYLISFLIFWGCIKSAKLSTPIIEKPTIKLVQHKTDVYLNSQVTLTGYARGWDKKYGDPPVRDTDWVFEDDTGFIFVTGGYPKGFSQFKPMEEKITIIGRVEQNRYGIVYLKFIAQIETE